jgi:ATP-dependent RNA helicase DHX8/PRP22
LDVVRQPEPENDPTSRKAERGQGRGCEGSRPLAPDAVQAEVERVRLLQTKVIAAAERARDERLRDRGKKQLHELERAVVEQDVLRAKADEAAKQLAVFNSRLLSLDSNDYEAVMRECRRLSPPNGRCLPFYSFTLELMEKIRDCNVNIVIGQTGSGKSTQMIQYAFDAGVVADGKQIVCTQPRKLAATSLATRVAEEWDGRRGTVGQMVGYAVGGARPKQTSTTKMKFVTNRTLLNEIIKDPMLTSYSVVIVDEAHERNVDTDILLGMLKTALQARADLRLIVTSATLDAELMSKYLGDCPVIRIPGRTFPVEVNYENHEDNLENIFVQTAMEKAVDVHKSNPPGDGHILVFLTGQEDIEKAIRGFQKHTATDNAVLALPLHGKLPPEETEKVFANVVPGVRKVIFATNQAETSITIEGIRYVIDSGMAKVSEYDSARGMEVLSLVLINRSSAEQRKGRAGRTEPGVCYRLYSQDTFEEMQESQTAEILRTHLGICILQLKMLGIADVDSFDFVEKPPDVAMARAMEGLQMLQCLTESGELTADGRITALMQMEPMLCRMVLHGCQTGCGWDCITLASILSVGGNCFFRGGNDEAKARSDRMKASLSVEGGDLLTFLHIFQTWETAVGQSSGATRDEQKAWCTEHCVNGKTMGTAAKQRKEILQKLADAGIKVGQEYSKSNQSVQRAVAAGYFMNIAAANGPAKAGFKALHLGQSCVLHPGSTMVTLAETPQYTVYQGLAQTSRLFMRNITTVDLEWILEFAPKYAGRLKAHREAHGCYEHFDVTDVCSAVCIMIIGKRGSTITKLEAEWSCILEPNPDEGTVRIWAPQTDIESVKVKMCNKIKELKTQLLNENKEEPIAGATRIVFGCGGKTSDVLLGHEYRKLFVSNVVNWSWLQSYMTQMEVADGAYEACQTGSAPDNTYTWGTLLFDDKDDAQRIKVDLDRRFQDGQVIDVRPCRALTTGQMQARDTSLRISWNTGKSRGIAFVNFSHVETAQQAASQLNYSQLDGMQLQCEFQEPGMTEMTVDFDESKVQMLIGKGGSTIKAIKHISGIVNSHTDRNQPGRVTFKGSDTATLSALRLVQEGCIDFPAIDPGAAVVSSKVDDRGSDLVSLKLKGLSNETDEESLIRHFGERGFTPVSANILREKHVNQDEGIEEPLVVLRSMMTAATDGIVGVLEDLQVFPPKSASGRGKAFATFSSPGCVAKAIDMFNNKPGREFNLGDGRIHVLPNLSCILSLPGGLATALRPALEIEVERLRDACKGSLKLNLVNKGSKGMTISINGDEAEPIAAARHALQPILTGSVFSVGDDGSAMSSLLNPQGKKAMEKIQAEIEGSYIHWDKRVNSISIFGSAEARDCAAARLRQYVQDSAKDTKVNVSLPPGGVRAVVGKDGRNLNTILETSGCREVYMDIRRQQVTCIGIDGAVRTAAAMVQASLTAVAAAAQANSKVQASEVMCGICMCDVEEDEPSVRLQLCRHVFHRDCINIQLGDASKPGGAWPIQCAKCSDDIIMRDLTQCCNANTLQLLCKRSYKEFCDSNCGPTGAYQPCPTPDCPQLVSRSHEGQWHCDCCLRHYCMTCTHTLSQTVDAHHAVGCEEYQLRIRASSSAATADETFNLFIIEGLKSNGPDRLRRCPSCNVPNSKDNMCDHVTCKNCNRHFCFKCARFHAGDAGAVYSHMNTCGGYQG